MPRRAADPKDAPRALREACLEEAALLIAERGVEALSLREVARRLGVSHQAPYKHFESREHILAALIVRAHAAFADALDARAREEDPFGDLEALGRAYFEYAEADPLGYQLMFGGDLVDPAAHPALAEAGRRSFNILLEAVRRLPAPEGQLRNAELDALFAWSAVHGLVSLLQSHAVAVQDMAQATAAGLRRSTLARITEALGGPRSATSPSADPGGAHSAEEENLAGQPGA